MDLTENNANAARAAVLPMDCSARSMERLMKKRFESILSKPEGFRDYVKEAIKCVRVSSTRPVGVDELADIAVFAALTVLRIQKAEPFRGTKYEQREPPESAERRMLHQPLWKHPGLSRLSLAARRYYQSSILNLFNTRLPPTLQSEIASILLVPDLVSGSETKNQVYTTTSVEEIHSEAASCVAMTEVGVRIPRDSVSQCCRIPPEGESHVPRLYEDLTPPRVQSGGLVVPSEILNIKLAEYSWHGWLKLANIAYNTLTEQGCEQLVDVTSSIDGAIRAPFRRNNTVHTPYLGVEATENPKRKWSENAGEDISTKPLRIEDKRLITVIDCFRADPGLEFKKPYPVETVVERLRKFHPAPRRPGNDVHTKETLVAALEDASHSGVKVDTSSNSSKLYCQVPSPKITPVYPQTGRETQNPWDEYLKTRTRRGQSKPKQERAKLSASGVYRTVVDPFLPAEHRLSNSEGYKQSLVRSQRTAVVSPRRFDINKVPPLINPRSNPQLTHDEVVFVSRVALAMERLLTDYSLTNSMRSLRLAADGTQLEIDEQKLQEVDWLEKHEEGRALLYTVPAKRRKELSVPNVSHDGFGEKTPREKSVHRRGVDQVAASFAAKSEVDRVIRYCDLWRLRGTHCEEVLKANGLLSTRVDVIAFSDGVPKYAAGIETAANSSEKPQNCVDKLSALSESLETTLVLPNRHHMWTVMRRLHSPEYFDFDSFPDSDSDSYSRSNWVSKLANAGILGEYFDHLHSYRTLDSATINPKTEARQQKIVGLV